MTLLLGAEVGVHGVALEQPGAVQRELDTVPTPAEKMGLGEVFDETLRIFVESHHA